MTKTIKGNRHNHLIGGNHQAKGAEAKKKRFQKTDRAPGLTQLTSIQNLSVCNFIVATVNLLTKLEKRVYRPSFAARSPPPSHDHLKKNYFISTTGDSKFKDVRTSGRCLRCYGNNHKAASCKTYTRPTPTPCKYCFHLFHNPDECKFYTSDGKSRPPSANRALK